MTARRRRRESVGGVLVALILGPALVLAEPQASTDGRLHRTARITAITSELAIDGVLDEPAWATAPTIGDLIQRIPNTGEAPSQRTDVTLLRDANNLYIGVVCHD